MGPSFAMEFAEGDDWNLAGSVGVQSSQTRACTRGTDFMTVPNAGSGASKAQMNLTPLIDVLLVLIVVFMVIVSMTNEKGLEAQIPQPAPQSKTSQPEQTIVIQVKWNTSDRPSSLKINNDEVKWTDLHSRLQEIFAVRAERVAFVKGDSDVEFEDVAKVIDIARRSERVGLLTQAVAE
jgi:biopolymer transport protein TolR